MNSQGITYRDQLKECLGAMASGKELLDYEKNVPVAYVPHEVACQFFDDFYHPKASEFLDAFSEEEIKEIGILSGYLHIALEKVDLQGHPKVSEVLKIPEWRSMMKRASILRESLNKEG